VSMRDGIDARRLYESKQEDLVLNTSYLSQEDRDRTGCGWASDHVISPGPAAWGCTHKRACISYLVVTAIGVSR